MDKEEKNKINVEEEMNKINQTFDEIEAMTAFYTQNLKTKNIEEEEI